MTQLKILHIITSLDQGGAEAVLCRLVAAKEEGVEYSVISLKGEGFYGNTLRANGLVPYSFKFKRFFQLASFFEFVRLVRLIASLSPDVVQTWLYHADLIGGLAARLAGCRRIVWGIRTANLSPALNSRFTLMVAWFCARLSGILPAAIATCSIEAAKEHKKMGYDPAKFHVIPNGFDLRAYVPDTAKRQQLRAEWGVAQDEVLFGCVARWDPYKDHPNLLQALSFVAGRGGAVRCVLVGGGLTASNTGLMGLLAQYNLTGSVVLAGTRSDIPSIMNALDFHLLPSASEAFPNVVAEAMACGTPCVVTNVGDAALIVGDTGWIVPPKNPGLLARTIEEARDGFRGENDAKRRINARRRIEDNFSLEKMTQAYLHLWQSVALK
ncbi:MAG: glycosyltransferase [Acidovorax sp.]|nr:glycosyltransferase [Acidovorax sp.]